MRYYSEFREKGCYIQFNTGTSRVARY